MAKDVYALHLNNPAVPVTLLHPETKEEVKSWSTIVSHEKKNFFRQVVFKEAFDFAAGKICTINPKTNVIEKVEELNDPARAEDVKKAYEWLQSTHGNTWFLREGEVRGKNFSRMRKPAG